MTSDAITRRPLGFARSAATQQHLHELIPGGAHTYARGSDQYPELMAPVLVRGVGARVLDVDGNWLVEYGMGLRSVTLGHGFEPVARAVAEAAYGGVNFSRPTVWEERAAETFLTQVPGAEMVKFAKNGSDVTTAAVKLARAATGRPLVAVCGSQPFFSTDDWFITTTTMRAGITDAVDAQTLRFHYNDLDSLRLVFDTHPGQVAAVILEPGTATTEPEPGFLPGLMSLAHERGSVVVFDEMITGMRWSAHGAQHLYGVTPDLSTWGKALGNGFAISALAGRRELMELGGLNTDRARVFLLSTTHGAETTGLAAYLAVAEAYRERDAVTIMEQQGARLAAELNAIAEQAGVGDHVRVLGRPSCLVFATSANDGLPSQEFRTLFLQEMLGRGVLGQSFVISAAHGDDDLATTAAAMQGACRVYAHALEAGSAKAFLRGRPVAPALREVAHPRRLPDGAGLEEERS